MEEVSEKGSIYTLEYHRQLHCTLVYSGVLLVAGQLLHRLKETTQQCYNSAQDDLYTV